MIIQPFDVERLKREFQAAAPFPHVAIDGFLDPDFAREVASAYPTFAQAERLGFKFKAVNEYEKVQITEVEKFPDPVRRLSEALSAESFRRDLSEISGIDDLLWDPSHSGGGMHMTGPHGHLDVHVDFNQLEGQNLYRRLNLLVYLNPGWREEWGGAVEIWDPDVKTCHGAFAPVLNRAVMFATSATSWHGVTAVTCPPDHVRCSFAVYYYTEAVPSWFEATHSTIFRARPDEHVKKYLLMPAQRAKDALRDGKAKAREARDGIKRLLGR